MKSIKNSFLFLFLLLLSISGAMRIEAQNQGDSLNYYYDPVRNFKESDELIKAYKFFERKIKDQSIYNPYVKGYCNYNIASIEYYFGAYNQSEIRLVKSLQYASEVDSLPLRDSLEKGAFTLLANVYRKLEDKEKVLELTESALQRARTTKDSAVIINNRSNIYKDFKEFDNARIELEKAMKLFDRLDDKKAQARILDNLGHVYSKLNDHKLGLKYLLEGMNLRLRIKDSMGLYSSYRSLSRYYLDKNKDSIAYDYAKEGYKIASVKGTLPLLKNSLGILTELSDDSYARSYKKISDSISSIQKKNENSYAWLKYNYSEYKRQALESELQREAQKRKTMLFQFIGVLILVIAIAFIVIQRDRNKRHTLMQVHNTERQFSKKVHDELGNDIFYLMTQIQSRPETLLQLQGLKVLDGLNEIYTKARDISKKYSTIDTGAHYHEELVTLLNSFGTEDTKIIINQITPDFWEAVPAYKKEELYRVLQELLTNMKKHSEANFVAVTFEQEKGKIRIKYVDNGNGVDTSKLNSKNGLHNVENRMEGIQGSFSFDSSPGKGFKAEIQFNV